VEFVQFLCNFDDFKGNTAVFGTVWYLGIPSVTLK